MSTNRNLPREWMRQLAALRNDAARLRSRSAADRGESAALMDRALELTDVLRQNAAELQARCVALEHAVAERDRRLRALVELIPMPVVATDRGAMVVDANATGAALLGRSVGRLRNELLLHYAEDRTAFSAIIQRLPSITEPYDTRLRIRPRERAPLELGVTVAPDIRDDGGNYLWFFCRC